MMPTQTNYKDSYRKRASKKNDQFSAPKRMTLAKDIDEQRRNNLIDWCTFYRRNIHHFVSHYFGIKLHFYQKIWLYLMSTRDSFVAIAARASAKTWLAGVLACARAVLYPKSEIVVVASTKEQAGIIVEEKIKSLMDASPNLCREISNVTTNLNKWAVEFHNGSIIKVVAARDSSRGKRSTFTIYEEFRLIDKEVIDSVIRPFSYIRQAGWLKNPLYEQYAEESKEIFISSAYHKGLWWWDETKKTIRAMLRGDNVGFIALDVRVALEHKIKTLKQIKNDLSKMDEIVALEEVYNIPWGENSDAFFKLRDMTRARKIEKAFYPQRSDASYNPKKNPYGIVRTDGEVRLLSCDLAQRSGRQNDLSITWCIRLLPTTKGYFREICYGEAFSGISSIKQSLRIKQVFHDFDADAMVLDVGAGGGGIPIYDMLGQVTKDSERDLEYPAMTIMPHSSIEDSIYEELKNRTLGVNALPVIYPISASAKLNSSMAIDMKDKFKKRLVGLLVDETRAEDYLIKTRAGEYMKNDDISAKAFFMQPYTQCSLLVNEAVGLSGVLSAGNIKLVEVPGARKDRIVSLMMGSYYASFLDAELLRDNDGLSDLDAILGITMIL
jgi:hypothetical protein